MKPTLTNRNKNRQGLNIGAISKLPATVFRAMIQWVVHVHMTHKQLLPRSCLALTVHHGQKRKKTSNYGRRSVEDRLATSCNGPCRSKMTHQDKHYGLSHSEAYVNWKKKICHGKPGQCLDKTVPEF